MIRYDIDNINYILKGNNLNMIQKNSYNQLYLDISFKDLSKIISDYSNLSPENRVFYIQLRILSENKISVPELSKHLEFSKETLKFDLRETSKLLKSSGILTTYSSPSELMLIGEERSIRRLLMETLLKTTSLNFSSLEQDLKRSIQNCLKVVSPFKLNEILKKFETEYKRKFLKRDFDRIFCILCSNVLRAEFITENYELGLKPKFESVHAEIKNNFLDIGIKLFDYEIESIREIIIDNHRSFNRDKLYIKTKFFIESLKARTHFNYNFSDSFIEGLATHIGETLLRKDKIAIFSKATEKEDSKFFHHLRNTLLEIFPNYPEEDVAYVYSVFKDPLTDFIFQNSSSIHAVLVTNNTSLARSMIVKNLKNNLNIEITEILPTYLFEIFGSNSKDSLIISTEHISDPGDCRVFKVSETLNQRDVQTILCGLYDRFFM
ncbi:MAG: helix-turn-helix domain-containing protein [Cetobacterium sp.]